MTRHIEEVLAERGERLLLVETSGLPAFEGTRAFYLKCGFTEVGRASYRATPHIYFERRLGETA